MINRFTHDEIEATIGLLRSATPVRRLRLIHCAINRKGGDTSQGRDSIYPTNLDTDLLRDCQYVRNAARRIFGCGRNLLASRHVRRRYPHLINRNLED